MTSAPMSDGQKPAVGDKADAGSTSWTLIQSAQRNDDGGAALNDLCRRYWRPVYIFARRDGLLQHDAEDATQEFFAYILDRSWLDQAGRDRGSFRGFLFALLRNFLSNRRRFATVQKRGGPRPLPPLDPAEQQQLENVAGGDPDPAVAYDHVWALSVYRAALDRLGQEQARLGHSARFAALRPFLTQGPASTDYDRLVPLLGQTRNQLAVARHRLSQRYRELIRAEVADTIADPAEIDAELRHLVEVLSR